MKQIGRYTVCGLLGKGGMSTVYKVRMPVTGKIVALKLLAPHPHLVALLGDREIRNRFLGEAITLARLRHPNIVDVWDCDEAEGTPFFIMEYYCNNLGIIMGESYRLETPSRPLGIDKAIHYGRQVLEGLSRLHQVELIHRDIKPFNVLLTDDDRAKISDFGLSRLRGETFPEARGLLVGSPYYAAPEQENDPDQTDERADLYSVGVMLYRMLTGLIPSSDCRKPSDCHPQLDAAWDRFLLRAMAPDRDRRFTGAGEMIEALEDLHAAWHNKQQQACQGVSQGGEKEPPSPSRYLLRSRPVRARPLEARELFRTDDLWRPLRHIANHFRANRDGTVTDEATGLVWQRSGSDYPMSWEEALGYVERLNRTRFAGRAAWRIPTVDELMSLLSDNAEPGHSCTAPLFHAAGRPLWSADRRSYTAAWYVNMEMGFVCWQDFSCCFFLRAVSGQEPVRE
jgi:serine/threonine-protein kinase